MSDEQVKKNTAQDYISLNAQCYLATGHLPLNDQLFTQFPCNKQYMYSRAKWSAN